MLGRGFFQISRQLTRSIIPSNQFSTTRWMASMPTHIETQVNFLRLNNVTNSLMIENLREMLLGKRNTVDAELADLTSISEVMSLILRGNQPSHVGTISAKCNDRHDL